MKNETDAELFDDLVGRKLGHYVYALFDPATGQPFYVGKGGGRVGSGNRRIFDHFDEARGGSGKEREKIEKIQKIWKNYGDVQWKIVRSGLESENEALLVESALIDMLREMKIPLTNKQSGHGSAMSGMKSTADLRAWCAPKLNISDIADEVKGRPIFLFNISKGVSVRRPDFPQDCPNLYKEATCQFWNVKADLRSYEDAIAVGCINGITRAAVCIERWEQESDTRWEIVPSNPTNGTKHLDTLIYKNVSAIIDHCKGFWQRGNFLVVRIEDDTTIKVIRGAGDRQILLSVCGN